MPVISTILNRISSSRLKEIDNFRKDPAGVQEKVFFSLVRRAAETEWGKLHGYDSIRSPGDFRSRVKVQSYEDIIPWVERLRKGEKNLLWPGEVRWFAKSSGTTSTRSKFIPVTRESLEECHFRGSKDVTAVYIDNRRDTRIFNGRSLILGGSHKINNFNNRSLYGDLSAILIENAPAWFSLIRTPGKEIALTEDFEEKLNMIASVTVKQNITSISGVPSWYLVLIKLILSLTGKNDLHEVWPDLEVFFHGGISFAPYRDQFRHFIKGSKMHYMETYNASEGFFGLQDDPGSSDMLLMMDLGIYYEFIPLDKVNSENPPVFNVDDVQKDIIYAIVISTNGGLWRYMIGDTIQFTGLRPHKFIISGRTRHFINAFGEEVIIENAEKAIDAACRATGSLISEYTAGPVFIGTESKGTHEWIIEFETEPADMTRFTEILDEALKSVNSDYEAKRFKDLNLVCPIVRSVPKGTFYRWLKEKNKLGGQNKVPRLANSREYIEEIYKIAGVEK